MICPYCNEEMEAGVIQSPHQISWKRKRRAFNRAEFYEGSIILSELSILRGSAAQAFCCRKCEKIIIDYRNGNCDMN